MRIIQQDHEYIRAGTQKEIYSDADVIDVVCPYCGADDKERIWTENEAIGVSRCRRCDLVFSSPRLRAPEQIYWGDADKYYEEARLIVTRGAAHHRDPNYLEEIELIEKWRPSKGRFLDVGCNMGFLLRLAKARGWAASGCEPSTSLAGLASTHFGLEVFNCFLHDLPAEVDHSFDVVALSDVFEHIAEPLPFLADVQRVLAPGGVVYVKVPNARWSLFKQQVLVKMGKRPSQGVWDSYEHVVHYVEDSLRTMLERAGLRVDYCGIARPVQVPIWHERVGHYFQYPSPWWMDWRRHVGRSACYQAARVAHRLRPRRVGPLAPNIVMIASGRG